MFSLNHITTELISLDTTQRNPKVQAAPSVQPTTNQEPSIQSPACQALSNLTSSFQSVAQQNSHGAMKRRHLKVSNILNLSCEECIIVEFDDVAPVGEAQGLLAGFCGILFPKPQFSFETTESIARRYVYNSISRKWDSRRLKLWDKTFDPLKSRSKLMANVPSEISPDQWTSYVDYLLDKKTQKMCKQNMVEIGHKPGRAELYLAIHKKEDGSYVNEASKEICEKIKLAVSQSTVDESKVSPNDDVDNVLGKEHSGRVRCLGLGDVPSRYFKQPSDASSGPLSDVNERSFVDSYSSHNH
ncbi:hypothetical protein P3L10_025799 [Capsicum annuum]